MLTPFEQRWYGNEWKFFLPFIWLAFFLWLVYAWIGDNTIDFLPDLGLFTLLVILAIPATLLVRSHKIRQSCWRFYNMRAMYQNVQKPPERR